MAARFGDDWARRRRTGDEEREGWGWTRSAPDLPVEGILTIDEAGIIQAADPAVEQIFGEAAAELIGRSLSSLVPEPDPSTYGRYLAGRDGTGPPRIAGVGEVTGRRHDGSLVHLDLTVAEFVSGDRRTFTLLVREISGRKQDEAAAAHLAALVESTDAAVISKDLDGRIMSWNGGAERMFGYRAEEVLSRPILPLIPPDRQHEESTILEQIRRGERVKHHQSVRITRDGRRIDLWLTISPMRDWDGRIIGASTIARDITEQKRAERALRESERMLRDSQRMAHIGSWELDLDDPADFRRGTLRWSEECYRIFGYEPGQVAVTMDLFLGAVHPDDRDRVADAADRALRGGEEGPRCVEHRITRPDGTERVVVEWDEIVRDSDRRPVRMIGTCQDITERKRSEAALQQYAGRLKTLRAIDRVILSSRSPRDIARAALEQLAHLVPCWTGGVLACDLDREGSEVLASRGLLEGSHPPGTRLRGDSTTLAEIEALRQGRIAASDEVRDAASMSPVMGALRAAGMRSYVLLPLSDQGRPVGALFLSSDRPAGFSQEQIEVARDVADHLAVGMQDALLFEQVEVARGRLADLSRRLIRAQEDERRHIARELHDEVGQALTAVKIHLQVIGQDLPESAPTRVRLDEGIALIERTLRQIRSISLNLRPPMLDDLGLIAALRSFTHLQARVGGFAARLDVVPGEWPSRLEPEVETACFRVAQEALTNVVRHAGAREVVVELRLGEGRLDLVVRDDGAGFDVEEARSRSLAGASLGLLGMEERVALLGGRLAIRSEPGRGTEVSAGFPLSLTPTGERGPDR